MTNNIISHYFIKAMDRKKTAKIKTSSLKSANRIAYRSLC
jgi:hypothetical protein